MAVALSDTETKEQVKESREAKDSLISLNPLTLLLKRVAPRGLQYRLSLFDGKFVATNGTAGKYAFALSPGVSDSWSVHNVSSCPEWTNLANIFDEFFVRKVTFHYRPVNKYSGVGGSAGVLVNLNHTMMVWVGLQHDNGLYTDSSSAFINCAHSQNKLIGNSAEQMRFVWKNVEKFAWDGPVGDQTTANMTQSWCITGSPSKYGGFIQAFSPSVTSASPGVASFAVNSNVGTILVEYDVCFRVRA
jgi:hypothetical protein